MSRRAAAARLWPWVSCSTSPVEVAEGTMVDEKQTARGFAAIACSFFQPFSRSASVSTLPAACAVQCDRSRESSRIRGRIPPLFQLVRPRCDRSGIDDRSLRTATYSLSNTITLSDSSPFAVVTLIFEVSVLPSLDTTRLLVPTALPPFLNVNLAVLLSTCWAERLS
jgi:hypothetical protein